jgi:PLD-like domain
MPSTEIFRPCWIVHSKAIVVDPFSDDCAVITGSHNFSVSASDKNDENLVIVHGNTKLAQAYALHINGVYDHYSWRAYLASGGDPDQIYKPLNGWKPGGSRAQELDFWMNDPIPPQSARRGTSPSFSEKKPARAAQPKPGEASKTSQAGRTRGNPHALPMQNPSRNQRRHGARLNQTPNENLLGIDRISKHVLPLACRGEQPRENQTFKSSIREPPKVFHEPYLPAIRNGSVETIAGSSRPGLAFPGIRLASDSVRRNLGSPGTDPNSPSFASA